MTARLCAVLLLWFGLSCAGAEEKAVTPQARNDLLDIPLFCDDDPWDDAAPELAARLHLPELSAASYCTLYQAYPNAEPAGFDEDALGAPKLKKYRVCGEKVVYAALYARDGKPQYLYFVFANKGDLSATKTKDKEQSVRAAILDDYNDIGRRVTKKLGKAEAQHFITPYSFTADIWGWRMGSTMITISCPYNELVEMRILPAEWATKGNITEGMETGAAALAGRLKRNGDDATVRDLLMIDQGPKGYCLPATCERLLRYYGFHAEYYLLSSKMRTRWGGGTTKANADDVIDDFIRGHALSREQVPGRFRLELVQPYLDQGVPLLWYVMSGPELCVTLVERQKRRAAMTDLRQWRKYLDRQEAKTLSDFKRFRTGHVCLLVGYNATTREIAVSNSWGAEYALNWLTEKEAAALAQENGLTVILPAGGQNH